jgi:hypothetical protein
MTGRFVNSAGRYYPVLFLGIRQIMKNNSILAVFS